MDLKRELREEEILPLHHENNLSTIRLLKFKPFIIIGAISVLSPIILPFIHFGILSHLWDEYNFNVSRNDCKCFCWDTIYKGPYERGPSGYKHIYFNITSNTLKIWAVTVFAVLMLYEAIKKLCILLYKGQLRISMFALLVLSIYPHYYSWWSYFNYWNDDFYSQWNHQLFFSITEFISTLMVVHLLDRRIEVTSVKCLVITGIAILHILSSGVDQFVDNVIRGNGMLHQVLRDIFFMIPDLCHAAFPLLELKLLARRKRLPSTAHTVTSKQFFTTIALIFSGWLFCRRI